MREIEDDFSFKQLFIPLTNKKALSIIVLVGIVVFFNALYNGFVWDDKSYILNNSDIHQFSLTKIIGSSYFNKDGYYRPFPAFYFSMLYAFFKDQAFFYHFVQITIHLINTVLIFRLFTYFFRKEVSLIAALFFLVHPMNVESVAFIGATISPLYVLFGLGALLVCITKKTLSTISTFAIACLLFLSLLTKEGGILFFLITLAYTCLCKRASLLKLLFSQAIVFIVYLYLRVGIGKVFFSSFETSFLGSGTTVSDGRFVPIMELSFIQRLSMIPSILLYYIKTFFYPVRLAVDQTWVITTLTLKTFYLPLLCSLLFFGILFFFAWYLHRIKSTALKSYVFFGVWFLIGLGMHMQIVPLDMTVADRWFYFPIIGLLGMIGVLVDQFLIRKKAHSILVTTAVLLLIIFSVRTMMRNANFVNEISLYSHDIHIETNYELELNLGSAYGVIGELDKTLTHYQKSVALSPNEANYDNLGLFSEWKGNFKEAEMYYRKALHARSFYLNPKKRLSFTYIRLSFMYLLLHDPENARRICLEGLKQYPNDHDLWIQLAQSEYLLSHHEEALVAAKKALAIKTDEKTLRISAIIETKQPLEVTP